MILQTLPSVKGCTVNNVPCKPVQLLVALSWHFSPPFDQPDLFATAAAVAAADAAAATAAAAAPSGARLRKKNSFSRPPTATRKKVRPHVSKTRKRRHIIQGPGLSRKP